MLDLPYIQEGVIRALHDVICSRKEDWALRITHPEQGMQVILKLSNKQKEHKDKKVIFQQK